MKPFFYAFFRITLVHFKNKKAEGLWLPIQIRSTGSVSIPCNSVFDVVQQAFWHERILVQVNQVRCLWRETDHLTSPPETNLSEGYAYRRNTSSIIIITTQNQHCFWKGCIDKKIQGIIQSISILRIYCMITSLLFTHQPFLGKTPH